MLVSAAVPQRAGVLLGTTAGVALLHSQGVPMPACPWRSVTGIPCPFCGATTAALAVADLDPAAALQASPLVMVGALVMVGLPAIQPHWRRIRGGWRAALLCTAALASEVWQLVRLGLL